MHLPSKFSNNAKNMWDKCQRACLKLGKARLAAQTYPVLWRVFNPQEWSYSLNWIPTSGVVKHLKVIPRVGKVKKQNLWQWSSLGGPSSQQPHRCLGMCSRCKFLTSHSRHTESKSLDSNTNDLGSKSHSSISVWVWYRTTSLVLRRGS